MVINQNILAILRTFANLKKKKIYIKETTSKAATIEFLTKISNKKKTSNEQLTFSRQK